MTPWIVAAVQMDCRLGETAANLAVVRERLRAAAGQGARLIVFPECILSGYGMPSRTAVREVADSLPGQATEALAADCAALGVFAVVGLIESSGDKLYNACALIGP